MDTVYMLQRKIRTLEEKTVPEYKSLVFYGGDDLSPESAKYLIKFLSVKGGSVTIETKFETEGEASLKLNGAKISAYKPVNGDYSAIFIADAVHGENLLEVDFGSLKPENITIKLSGYIEDIPDESVVTKLRHDGKEFISHYDDRLKRVRVYRYDGVLQPIYEEANLISAAIGRGVKAGEITLFSVSEDKTLTAKTIDLLSGSANMPTVIDEAVRMVSGTLKGSLPACYYIKDNAVKFCEVNGGIKVSSTGIKNACKISSTPNLSGVVAVIGYDRAATLYVAPQN